MDLKATLAVGGTIATAELEATRSALANATQKGGALEVVVRDLLRRHLPERIGISEGVVVSSDGFESRQMDLIIYDAADAPLFFNNGHTRIIPIEYVYAVVEVKARLDAGELAQTFTAQHGIKQARKHFKKTGVTYHSYGRDWLSPPIFSFLFAYDCATSGNAVFEAYKKMHAEHPLNECIDAIYINSLGLFARGSAGLGLDCGVGDCQSAQWVQEDPMFYLIAIISMLSTDWRIRETPELYRYLTGEPPAGNSAPLTSMPPAHPDLIPRQ